MVVVDGFEWYCEQHIAAPDDQFQGFLIHSVPHVMVGRCRNGAKGIAWVEDQEQLTECNFEYRYSGVDRWYIWDFDREAR